MAGTLKRRLKIVIRGLESSNYRYIESNEMENFIKRFQKKETIADEKEREIIVYVRDADFKTQMTHMALKKLSGKINVYVIVVCHLALRSESNYAETVTALKPYRSRFPELSWLPVHQFLLITYDLRKLTIELDSIRLGQSQMTDNDLPTFYSSLYGLLKNPNFNRFKNNTEALLPDYQFPSTVENTTVYFVSRLNTFNDWLNQFIEEDSDATEFETQVGESNRYEISCRHWKAIQPIRGY